jgi:outer membrane murein-binding lipoprotein Lpp
MDSITTLSNRVVQLRLAVSAKRDEANHEIKNSCDHTEAGNHGLSTIEANKALSLVKEIVELETRSLEAQKIILDTEQRIEKLQQQEVPILEESLRRAGCIDHDAKQKLDDISRQVRLLRG